MSITSDKANQNDAVASTCKDGPVEKHQVLESVDVLEAMLAKLKADPVVTEYATHNEDYKLVSYLWSKDGNAEVLPFFALKQHIFDQIACYKSAHTKSVTKALEATKIADEYFSNADFEAAIQHYGKVSMHCTNLNSLFSHFIFSRPSNWRLTSGT